MRKFSAALLFLFAAAGVHAQNISNKGKEFWVGYGHHQFMEPGQNNSQEMVIYLSAEQPATVTVSINGTAWTRTYNVPANSVIATEFMPKSGLYDCRLYSVPPTFGGTGGEGIFTRGINIKSNVPIVAYAHIFGSVSSGATMLMPIDAWGYNYYTLNSEQIDAGGPGYNWVYTVAQQNNTTIRITPSALTRPGKPAGVPFTVTLNKGEIYQIVGDGDGGGNGVQFTGTRVESIANASGQCFPIAVFAGSSRTRGEGSPCGSGSGRDNDMQQCFPTSTWGKRYLTAPFSTASGSAANPSLNASTFMTSVYKVAVKDPATVVKRNGVALTGLINGRYYRFSSNTADYIEADKPIMLAQYMSGSSSCNPGTYGDPEMIYLSPIEQAIKSVGFYRNTREAIYANYVTLVVPTGGVPSLRIDGSAAFSHTYPHPNISGYTVVIKGWKSEQAQTLMSCDSGFTAITYGLGGAESYGYNAGTFLNNLNLVGAIRNDSDTTAAVKQHDFTCKNSPIKLSAFYLYKPTSLVWQLSALASVISPNADVTDNSPVPVDSSFINGIKYYKYTLPGTYTFSDTGTFSLPILSSHPTIENCTFTEKLSYTITVKPTPRPVFTYTHSGCTLDTIYFAAQATTLENYNNQQYLWTFPGPSTATTQNVNKLLPVGSHPVNLRVITKDGCVGDTTRIVNVQDRPLADFTFAPVPVCEGSTVTFTDNSGVTGSGPGYNWYWDLGNGNVVNAATSASQATTYPGFGTYTVKHVVRSSNTCFSDTVTKTVTVYARPRTSFSFPTGCLPTNGQVQFTDNTTIPDGQPLSSWAWNFADPNANAGNPNTSTVQNPTHIFQEGTYPVKLTVTSQQGCVKDSTINVPVKITPALSYPALTAVCSNAAAFSIATATVTNGVAGTGIYNGPGTTAAGMFNPATAGIGTHVIWYVYTTSSGCKDSVSQTIQVRAKPVVSYTYPTGGCLPTTGLAQFNGSATLADAQTVSSWAWDFNDPNANAGNPNTSALQNPTHNFTANGIYNVKLTVTSSGGCTGDTTIALNFNIKPALAYPALNSVCQNVGGTINVATASVTNGASGTGVYIGPGTTPAGIFTPAVAGVGTHTIWYKFTTPNGCADSIAQTIQVKAKPVVGFTYPTGGCLPTDGLAQFNGSAALADAQTVGTWAWDFNDPNANAGNPNTSALQNPTHYFTANGIYNIKLTVTSSGGCTGDTTIGLNFNIKPALSYPPINSVCINAGGTIINVATAVVTNGVSGTGVYSGPGTTAAGIFTPAAAGVGTHTIWYKFTTPNGCADSVSQTVLVKAKPVVSYTYPTGGCLPANGLAQFNGSAALADAQTVSSWAWDFNDPNANAGNPNTSVLQNPTHNFTANGIYNVKLTVTSSGACTGDTTIALNFNIKPALAYPALNSVCQNVGGTINVATASVTNGASGTGAYSGPGTTPAGIFTPAVAGVGTHTIWYKFTTPNGCADSVSQTIQVRAKPVVSYTYPTGGCLPTTGLAQFNGSAALADAQTVSSWAWDFNDPNANAGNPNTSALQNPTHNFTANGIYNVKLTVTSSGGCTGDTTIALNFNIKPALAYPALNSVCQNVGGTINVATASVTNGASGTGVYIGPGTTSAGIFTPAVAGVGTHTIWYKFTTPNGCADSIAQTIQVKAKPVVSYTYPTGGCLPTNGLAQFNGSAALADAQTVSSWAWDFNDPNANAGNPNTSALQNPTHNFTANGIYNVKLTVTSSGGCTGDTSIALNFNIKPVLAYPALNPVCQSVAGTISVATASVTNGASGTGVYSGPGTNAAGQFSPAAAGAGTHTIWYKFTTPNGCADSVSQTIVVEPKPVAQFTATASVCLGSPVTFTDGSSISSGSISQWQWFFGDGNTATNNGGTFNVLYTNFNNYTAKLVTISAAGCVSDTFSQAIAVNPVPAAAFTTSASVCMPGGAVSFTNQSTLAQGSMTYSWNFGDGSALSSTTNPSHVYAAINNYTITLTASSAAGCSHTATRQFSAFFVKPIAAFDASPDTLCQGRPSIFQDLSTDPAGSAITAWSWNFADGTGPVTTQNTSKTYSQPGSYNVTLRVTNAAGCVSDVFSRPVVVYLQPVVDAGPSFLVPQGTNITFSPTVNDPSLSLTWSPAAGLSSPFTLRPSLTANFDQVYTLVATGQGGCFAADVLTVKVLKKVNIPNAFSPNGDGTNDRWEIENLADYLDCDVQIFNRYGQRIYQSKGYTKPWDGTINGSPMPVATYYYVIDLKNGLQKLSGSVTIIR